MTISRAILSIVVAVVIANTVSTHQGDHTKEGGWRDDDNLCGDNLTWGFNSKTLTIEGNGTMWDFDFAFNRPWSHLKNEIETILIKEGVTRIGTNAFSSFSYVTNVNIPRSLASIGINAFEDCQSLKQIVIPAGVTSIGSGAFQGCSRLKEISIPENVAFIGEYAFSFCDSLISITVDVKNQKFKSIDGVLFSKGGDILIQLPQGLSDTFTTIPDHVTSIGDGAFMACTFKTVTIPNNVTSIGNHAFEFCTDLSSIILPDSITSIGESAFFNCFSLTDITISKGVKSIPKSTFSHCGFTHISIPTSVTSIGSQAFDYCNSLVSIDIPDSVTWIRDYAFYSCVSLSHITIPGSITSIEPGTFSRCSSLNNIIIHNNITSIGKYAFCECNNLKQITVLDGVTSIGESAFSWSGLTNVTIPDSVLSIGENAFEKCSNLVAVFYLGSNYIQQSLFKSCDSLTNVCVSPDYNYTKFGGIDVTSSNQICHDFQGTFNHCFKASYVNGVFVQEKKLSAIEWEKRTNSCMKYQCINESGVVAWSVCNSTDDLNQFCIDNKCVANKETVENKKAYVEIDIEDGVKVVDMNTQQILETIRIHYGVYVDEVMVGYENDEQGNLLRIMIYVDNEKTAKFIADGLKDLKLGGVCENGNVLCRIKSLRVAVIMDQFLSGVRKLESPLTKLNLLFSFFVFETLLTN